MNKDIIQKFYSEAVDICVERNKDEPYPKAWDFEEIYARLFIKVCTDIVAEAIEQQEPPYTYVAKINKYFGIKNETNISK